MLQTKYTDALNANESQMKDNTVYRGDEIEKYGLDFLGYVDPKFLRDMMENFEWY